MVLLSNTLPRLAPNILHKYDSYLGQVPTTGACLVKELYDRVCVPNAPFMCLPCSIVHALSAEMYTPPSSIAFSPPLDVHVVFILNHNLQPTQISMQYKTRLYMSLVFPSCLDFTLLAATSWISDMLKLFS